MRSRCAQENMPLCFLPSGIDDRWLALSMSWREEPGWLVVVGSDRVERERLGSPYEANSSDLDGGRARRS